jgi:hypothetical protein
MKGAKACESDYTAIARGLNLSGTTDKQLVDSLTKAVPDLNVKVFKHQTAKTLNCRVLAII